MQPIEYDGWPSKIDFQLVPALVVFQNVPDALILGVDRDVGDAAGHQRRADPAHLQPGERRRGQPGLFRGALGRIGFLLPGRDRREE
jgi:hypothetical protein